MLPDETEGNVAEIDLGADEPVEMDEEPVEKRGGNANTTPVSRRHSPALKQHQMTLPCSYLSQLSLTIPSLGNPAAKHQPAKEGESSSKVEEDDPFGFTPAESTNGVI